MEIWFKVLEFHWSPCGWTLDERVKGVPSVKVYVCQTDRARIRSWDESSVFWKIKNIKKYLSLADWNWRLWRTRSRPSWTETARRKRRVRPRRVRRVCRPVSPSPPRAGSCWRRRTRSSRTTTVTKAVLGLDYSSSCSPRGASREPHGALHEQDTLPNQSVSKDLN